MKKEIQDLLQAENKCLRLNKFCQLRRWQKDALGNNVDGLMAEFSITHVCDWNAKIQARDWEGIVAEVVAAQDAAFAAASNHYRKQLENGYIG